ncbi:hypothetical protein SEA_LITTLETOKYO_48 [Arthrobacter phage LittleTokyo]|nr:hypothetical protein SEA_LITTLETOKYO_48 [Arthrobacter phage LittleTokyo]
MEAWTVEGDGFATGPKMEINDGDRSVVIQAVWSDEDGVCVSLDGGDEPLPAGLAWKVCAGMISLASTPAPVISAT